MQDNRELKQPKMKLTLFFVFLFICFTAFATVALANQATVTVDASVVNVRTGPGLSYDVMTQVGGGETVNIIAEENQWFKVRLSNDQIGWIASWLIDNTETSAATNMIGVITGTQVNVRDQSNLNSDIIGTVAQGTELTVLFQQDGWTQVQYMGQVAWISSDLIEVTTQQLAQSATGTAEASENSDAAIQTITVRSDGTNIRSGASIDDGVIMVASQGDDFTYLGAEGDWYHVESSDGTQGYVANWVVDLSTTEVSAPTASTSTLAEATIVLDAGHGGIDPGAPAGDYNEDEITLLTALMLQSRLRDAGANVLLTRADDSTVSLNDRAYISNQSNADLFISLHYDSTDIPNEISGTTTYYYHERDKALAETINSSLSENGTLPNNGTRFGDYFVLRENTRPAVLLELGYLNHDIDRSTVNSDSYRAVVVESIYQALQSYFVP